MQSVLITGCHAQSHPDVRVVRAVANNGVSPCPLFRLGVEPVSPGYRDKSAGLCGTAPSITKIARIGSWTRSRPAGFTFVSVGTRGRRRFRLRIWQTNVAASVLGTCQRFVQTGTRARQSNVCTEGEEYALPNLTFFDQDCPNPISFSEHPQTGANAALTLGTMPSPRKRPPEARERIAGLVPEHPGRSSIEFKRCPGSGKKEALIG